MLVTIVPKWYCRHYVTWYTVLFAGVYPLFSQCLYIFVSKCCYAVVPVFTLLTMSRGQSIRRLRGHESNFSELPNRPFQHTRLCHRKLAGPAKVVGHSLTGQFTNKPTRDHSWTGQLADRGKTALICTLDLTINPVDYWKCAHNVVYPKSHLD